MTHYNSDTNRTPRFNITLYNLPQTYYRLSNGVTLQCSKLLFWLSRPLIDYDKWAEQQFNELHWPEKNSGFSIWARCFILWYWPVHAKQTSQVKGSQCFHHGQEWFWSFIIVTQQKWIIQLEKGHKVFTVTTDSKWKVHLQAWNENCWSLHGWHISPYLKQRSAQ